MRKPYRFTDRGRVRIIIIINRGNNHPVPDYNLYEHKRGADRADRDCRPVYVKAPCGVTAFGVWSTLPQSVCVCVCRNVLFV